MVLEVAEWLVDGEADGTSEGFENWAEEVGDVRGGGGMNPQMKPRVWGFGGGAEWGRRVLKAQELG